MSALRRSGLTAAASLSLLLLVQVAPARADAGPILNGVDDARGDAAGQLKTVLAALEQDPASPQVTLLLGEARRCWDEVEGGRALALATLERALEKLGDHFNRDDILAQVIQLRRASGDLDGALAAVQERGFLRKWWVTGCFGLRPNAALFEVHEPERVAARSEVDLSGSYHTRSGEEASWRPLELDPLDASVSVSDVLEQRGSVAYALTHVKLSQGGPAYLVWAGPSARIWVNRALATVIDRNQERLDGELRIPVQLREGWNRILVKVSGGRNARFSLRLLTHEGKVIAPQDYAAAQPVPASVAAAEHPLSSYTLEGLSKGSEPEQRALYAWALAVTNRGEEAYLLVEQLRQEHPELAEQPWYWYLAGRVAGQADQLPDAVQRDQARADFEHVLKLDPAHVGARRALAEFQFRDDKQTKGILLLEAILAEQPDDVQTALRLFDVEMGQSWLYEAGKILEDLVARHPDLTGVLHAQARLLEQRGRDQQAQVVRDRLFAQDQSQVWVLIQRLQACLKRGDRDGALKALNLAAAQKVWSEAQLARHRSQLLLALGDDAGAAAALQQALTAQPWKLDLQVKLAGLLVEEDQQAARTKATDLLDAVLTQEPGQHSTRRLRNALGKGEDRFWDEWEPDVPQLLKEAPGADHWPRAATACLFDQTVTRIWPDGASQSVVHQLFRILDDSGKERYGSRPQAGRLLKVRTITPDGETLCPIDAGGSFQMPGLAPGAVVEHAFETEQGPPGLQLSDGPFYFQDPDLSEPFWFSRWVIMVHRDADVELVERNLNRKGITRKVEDRGEWKVYIYTAQDQPRIQKEPAAPSRDEFLPWVKVLQRRSLEELGELYREQSFQGTQVTPSVRAKAEEVVKGLDSDAAKAQALFRFVKEYLQGNSGGTSASQILASRSGSATVLLLTMLRAVDVPVSMIAAAPNDHQGAAVDWDRPELGHFTSLLLRVEPRDGPPVYVFANGPRLAPYDQLPAELWGATSYVCDPAGGLLEVLPPGDPATETNVTRTRIELRPEGAAHFEVQRVIPGYGAYGFKERFASAPAIALRQFFAQQAVGLFPGAQLVSGEAPGCEVAGRPLELTYAADVDQALRSRGEGGFELVPGFTPSNLTASLGSYRERQFDLLLRDGTRVQDQVRIALGPYTCPRLPANVTLADKDALFSLRFRREGPEEVVVERQLVLKPGRVLREDYPAFREFLRKVDEAEARTLVLEARKQGATPEQAETPQPDPSPQPGEKGEVH